MSLKNLTALITGGGSGIGLATARLFVERGANVAIASRSKERLQEALLQLDGAAGAAAAFCADVSNAADVQSLVENTVGRFGKLDVLINNAGVFIGGDLLAMHPDDFASNLATNLTGSWLMCRYAAPHLIASRQGSIVFVSSYLAIRAHHSTPASGYAASKAGMLGLMRSLAVELAPHKVRVNAVLPAVVDTAMVTQLVGAANVQTMMEKAQKAHPIGRAGKPEDVARAIAFLADPENSWITGAELPVDGGRSVI